MAADKLTAAASAAGGPEGRESRRPAAGWLARAPHWVWPLVVGAAFLAVGIVILDDYPVSGDAYYSQRPIAIAAVDRALGREPAPFEYPHDRLYGAAFEVLPLFVERIAGLEDIYAIHLTRHLMTHLFFIIGGIFCYLLAYRMTGSRLLGLFAMLLFLLHPRLYGNSFFNSKDIPFLSMFMIALFCIHWAFRKGTVGAFLVCGVAVGILVNLRIMGVMLLPAVLIMRCCDLYYAAGGAERRRVISSGVGFALASSATYFASMPYLWGDPIAHFAELVATFSQHPLRPYELFQGRYVNAAELPARYIPVWVAITTPPAALLLAGVGVAAVSGRTIAAVAARAGAAWRNTELRFELLLVGSAVAPVIGVIALESVVFNGWRHLYFLWAPLCLLAAGGLRQARGGLSALARHCGAGRIPALTFARMGPASWGGRAVIVLAVVVLAGIAVQMIRLHPYQHLYFNVLVDRATPEYLKTQYEMDYHRTARLEAYRYLLENHPDAVLYAERGGSLYGDSRFLEGYPEYQRRRFGFDRSRDADYYILDRKDLRVYAPGLPEALLPPIIYDIQVYHNTITSVAMPDLARAEPAVAAVYREIYQAVAGREPTLRAVYDLHLNEPERTLTLVKEDCRPGDLSTGYGLRIYPADANDLPYLYQRSGHINAMLYGVRFDGKCLMQAALPDYDLARINVYGVGEILSDGYLAELRRQYAALRATEPAIRADFAVYVENGKVRYIKDECDRGDTAAPFFLHIIPADTDNLPATRREYGFDNLDFKWTDYTARDDQIYFDGKCMSTARLPDYEIHGIRTGQYRPDLSPLWSGEFYTEAYDAAQAAEYAARAVGAPAAAGFFSVYQSDGALTYDRVGCAAADPDARFFLHIVPAAAGSLSAAQREHGFDNRDFEFGAAGGVRYEGRCLVSVPLPDYAIASIHTGQYTPDAGRLWEVQFAVGE